MTDERADGDDGTEVDGTTFRPYLLTRGRTRSAGGDLPLEALVVTRRRGDPGQMVPEQLHILASCRTPTSIAEIAVELAVPIGVARVLVSDLAASGHVEVCDTLSRVEYDMIRRLIDGVRAAPGPGGRRG